MDNRLHWSRVEKKSFAYNEAGENVGHLSYERVGAHMHWCWYQEIDFRMSPGCLQEVRNMQKKLIKERNLSNSSSDKSESFNKDLTENQK